MSMAVDGLISGLDTTSLINSLMTLEAGPQNQLKAKVTSTNTLMTALQGLNSQIASLATLAGKATATNALDLYSAKSSSTGVSVTAGATATSGSIDIVVDKLAQGQASVSSAVTAWPTSSFSITNAASGVATTISSGTTNLDDIVTAVNASAAGVTAVKVAAGKDASNNPLYRLQFTSTSTGASSAFSLSFDPSDPATDPAMTQVKGAQDAEVRLWANTGAAQKITSSTNTFSDLLPGVSVTASAVAADPVTVSVSRNDGAVGTIASDLVGALNGVFALISTKSAVVNSTDSTGKAILSAGVFSSDSTVRDVKQQILNAASQPIDGRSPSEIGISITKSGTMEFDSAKFATAMAADPNYVKGVLATIAARVEAVAENASDKYDGMITSRITGQESLVKSLGTQIDGWDIRMASRRSTLERTYSAMEVQLSNMNAQSAWLTAQVDGLNASNGK
ncbi:flagellar hook-associated protein 2 [Cryobacterium flavum]|uniref:Flagellar hook-associated protein 2 n=1 Tax=Cryobacterium flavum TaxID=1424659 RepID=A0A4R8UVM4_9MICO|nr:flagellar filament capping protein FliD [Cryobacterium flavum]TFB73040.1 flagellar hook-associated protein [Cryobacterium flavum]SDN02501.1 flagellar hook-associated protein 2 [Cryobacterium flavum]